MKAARNKPLSVTPNDRLEIAITLMLASDFSQLPVMTNERTVSRFLDRIPMLLH